MINQLLKFSDLKGKELTRLKNQFEFWNTFCELFLDACDVFEWEGLPESINTRFLEACALMNGKALVTVENGVPLALICSPAGGVNVNGEWVKAYGTGLNGFNKEFSLYLGETDNSVITYSPATIEKVTPNAVMLKDNALMFPYVRFIYDYAAKIADVSRSLDVIAKVLKSPVLITAPEQLRAGIINAVKAVDENNVAVVSASGLPIDAVKVLDLGADPQRVLQLWEYRENLKAEIREKLGIQNNPDNKKRERMITAEAEANTQQTRTNLEKRLKYRKEFAENLNAFYGWNVSVKLAKAYETKEGDEDETENDSADSFE